MYIHRSFCLNPHITHGDMNENVSGCFFSEHSVYATTSINMQRFNLFVWRLKDINKIWEVQLQPSVTNRQTTLRLHALCNKNVKCRKMQLTNDCPICKAAVHLHSSHYNDTITWTTSTRQLPVAGAHSVVRPDKLPMSTIPHWPDDKLLHRCDNHETTLSKTANWQCFIHTTLVRLFQCIFCNIQFSANYFLTFCF